MTFRGQIIPILPIMGLNTGDNPYNISELESPDCRNVRFHKKSIGKRDGIDKYIATAADADAVVGIMQHIATDTGATKQIVAAGDSLVEESAGAWASVKGALTLTSGQDSFVSSAQLTNILVGTNDVNPVWAYTGAGNAAALAGVVAGFLCKSIIDFKNYLWTLNTSEGGTRRQGRGRWSALSNTASWPAANFNDILNNTGYKGTGLAKWGDHLVAFFDRAIQEVFYTGDTDTPFVFPDASVGIGAVSGQSIVTTAKGIFFASYKGIYLLRGGEPEYVSRRIEGLWSTLNQNRLAMIVGGENKAKNEVMFAVSVAAATTNDLVLVYNYEVDRWTAFGTWAINAVGYFPATMPTTPLIGNYSGLVFKTNTGTFNDNGSAIDAYVQTKVLKMGDAGRKCQIKKLQIIADSEDTGARLKISHGYALDPVSSQTQVDYSTGGAVFDTAVFDVDIFAEEGVREVNHRPQGHGRMFQLELRNDQLNIGLEVAECFAHTIGEGRPS